MGGEGSGKVAYSPATTAEAATFHRRRTSSRGLHATPEGLNHSHLSSLGTTSFIEEDEDRPARKHMSLDRSPSPREAGGWSSPGLNTSNEGSTARSRGSSPAKKSYGDLNGGHVTWTNAKAISARVKGQASYQSQNQGFFSRHMRRISERLPYFAHGGQEDRYREKGKLGRDRGSLAINQIDWRELPRRIAFVVSRRRKYVAMLVSLILLIVLWFNPSKACLRTFDIELGVLTISSCKLLVSKDIMARRRQQVCNNTWSKPRRWCNGMEGTTRMGNRKRQC